MLGWETRFGIIFIFYEIENEESNGYQFRAFNRRANFDSRMVDELIKVGGFERDFDCGENYFRAKNSGLDEEHPRNQHNHSQDALHVVGSESNSGSKLLQVTAECLHSDCSSITNESSSSPSDFDEISSGDETQKIDNFSSSWNATLNRTRSDEEMSLDEEIVFYQLGLAAVDKESEIEV